MKQETIVRIASEDKKMTLLCDSDVALGNLHDFLLMVKGEVVSRIVEAQKQEKEASDAVKAKDAEKLKEEAKEVEVEEVK